MKKMLVTTKGWSDCSNQTIANQQISHHKIINLALTTLGTKAFLKSI